MMCQRPIANRDQESWVMARIRTASKMIHALHEIGIVGAERQMVEFGEAAIIEAAAAEIIITLGMVPEYANIRRHFRRISLD